MYVCILKTREHLKIYSIHYTRWIAIWNEDTSLLLCAKLRGEVIMKAHSDHSDQFIILRFIEYGHFPYVKIIYCILEISYLFYNLNIYTQYSILPTALQNFSQYNLTEVTVKFLNWFIYSFPLYLFIFKFYFHSVSKCLQQTLQ